MAHKKYLEPIFGAACRTQSFAEKEKEKENVAARQHVYFEIWLDDPVRKTWTLSKVVHKIGDKSKKAETRVLTSAIKNGMSFIEALEHLATTEQDWRTNSDRYSPLYPDPPQMGFSHFRAFAEREGYVFDSRGLPHARPAHDVLPVGIAFLFSDIEAADKNRRRPENEFDNGGPASKIPQTHFIFDQFTRAAHKNSLEESLHQLRVLDILDSFAGFIATAHEKMSEYCENYHMLGCGGLMTEADGALATASAMVRQLHAYGLETGAFESFVLQCQITCHILHAQGLYDLMSRGKGDFEQNEIQFKACVTRAMEAFRRIDNTEAGREMLENMIVQSPKPEVPAAIGLYLEHYTATRANRPELPPLKSAAPRAAKNPKP